MTEPTLLFESSRAALGAPNALAAVHSVSAYADCTGPHSAFVTEIHSARDGRVRFQQTFAGRNSYCIILNRDGAWATDTVTGKAGTLDVVSVSLIGMELSNPRQPNAQVRVVVHPWRTFQKIALPVRVSATDTQGEYIFDFQTVLVNHAAPETFVQPRAIVRKAHAM